MVKKSNKELGFYWAIYTCINCGTKMSVKVTFGKGIPIFSSRVSESNKVLGIEESPECEYSGCASWSHGKKDE